MAMKIVIFWLIVLFAYESSAQKDFKKQSPTTYDKSEFYALYKIVNNYYNRGKSDSMKLYAEQLMQISKKLKNDSFIVASYSLWGNFCYLQNNHVSAIKSYFNGIPIAEKKNLTELLTRLYNNVGWNYFKLGYIEKALGYFKEGEKILAASPPKKPYVYIYENLAETYIILDSFILAHDYLRRAENLNFRDTVIDKYIQAAIYIAYGKLSEKLDNNVERARSYFKEALSYSYANGDFKHVANASYEYADFLLKNNYRDSAYYYSSNSLEISLKNGFKDMVIKNADLLSALSSTQKNLKQALFFSHLKDAYKDTLSILQNNNQLLSMTFEEDSRKISEEQKKAEMAHERKINIQYFIIALVLVSLIIAFLILTQSIMINSKTIVYLGLISLLITFEFINLVLHPFIEKITDHSPPIMLLILVLIASLLIPFHHFLENFIRIRLVEKHKRIRLEAAKKIIKEEE